MTPEEIREKEPDGTDGMGGEGAGRMKQKPDYERTAWDVVRDWPLDVLLEYAANRLAAEFKAHPDISAPGDCLNGCGNFTDEECDFGCPKCGGDRLLGEDQCEQKS